MKISEAIRAAYGTEGQGWKSLAEIRKNIPAAYDRETVDAGLRALTLENGVRIIPMDDAKTLTEAQREAALRMGGQLHHIMKIGK